MIVKRMKSRLPFAALITGIATLAGVTPAHAAYEGPVKEIFSSRIGWEVNKKTSGNFCLVASEECRVAVKSSEPGGFEFVKGVAVNDQTASAHSGHLYVIDAFHRVQELEANGSFVSMFGWDVNKTKTEAGAATTQAEKNLCTAGEVKSGVKCQPGVEGGAPGQLGESQGSIAIDTVDGSVYVSENIKVTVSGETTKGKRVQKFSADGEWVWEIGKEVNQTKDAVPGATPQEKNLCTETEAKAGVTCGEPARYAFGGEPPSNATEPGVFPISGETLVVVGGPEDLVYVGTGERVQEFMAGGGYKSQIPLAGTVKTIALDDSCQLQNPPLTGSTTPTCASFDPSFGDVYVLYSGSTVVHKLKPSGEEVKDAYWPLTLSARVASAEFFVVVALAVDPSGHVAVSESEKFKDNSNHPFGSIRDGSTGAVISEFRLPGEAALATLVFSAGDELYGTIGHEVLGYVPRAMAELLLLAPQCVSGPEHETSVTLDCTLNGKMDPWGVSETEAWFQWGRSSALGEETKHQQVKNAKEPPVEGEKEPFAMVSAVIEGVRPNERFFYYRLAANDANVKLPELLNSDTGKFATPTVAPWVGELSASYFTSSSAVLSGKLNPENAKTEYFFEYGSGQALAKCPNGLRVERAHCEAEGVAATVKQEAPCPELEPGTHTCAYGKIGAILAASGLQPSTEYRYRLFAESEDAEGIERRTDVAQGAPFTTLPNSVPQAVTGAVSALGVTSATIAGTVDPDGQPATYAFELGVEDGAATQYVVVSSGPAGEGKTFVTKELQLTGLQPGTTYAYRIKIASGYGTATGATETFTTAGLPSVLSVPPVLAQLPVPSISFPTEAIVKPKPKCKRGYKRDKHGKCVKVKPKKKGKKARKSAPHGKGLTRRGNRTRSR
jgi:hypothetical protein